MRKSKALYDSYRLAVTMGCTREVKKQFCSSYLTAPLVSLHDVSMRCVGVMTRSQIAQDKVTTLRKRADMADGRCLMQFYTSEPHLSASLQA